MLDDLTKVPELVVPLTVWAVIGHLLLALCGAAALAVGSLIATRSSQLLFGVLIAVLGAYLLGIGEHRFLRAVHPDSMTMNAVVWVVGIAVAIAGAVALGELLDAMGAGIIFAIGGLLALGGAIVMDQIGEQLHMIPLPWGVPVGGLALAIVFVFATSHR